MFRACLVLALLIPSPLRAQAPSPSPSAGEAETSKAETPKFQPDLTPRTVPVPGAPTAVRRDSADSGTLKGIRAVSTGDGEAVVVLGGVTRTVRPGDTIGADVVESVERGRIVLQRPEAAGGAAGAGTVVVTFDASGRGRVRVYSSKDATDRKPPEVR